MQCSPAKSTILPILALLLEQLLHVTCPTTCQVFYSPTSPYPWVIGIFNKVDVLRSISEMICQGALVSSNKVVSPCTVIRRVQKPQFSLKSHGFRNNGKVKCTQTQIIFKIQYHPECASGQAQADFALWIMPYPFASVNKPFLFLYRPDDQEFLKFQSSKVPQECELPVYIDEKNPPKNQDNIYSLGLDECKKVICPEANNTSCLPELVGNVSCAFAFHTSDVRVWVPGVSSDRQRGAVLVCDGFPVGIIGSVLPDSADKHKDFRILSSFLNLMNLINLPPKPFGLPTTPRKTTGTPSKRRPDASTTLMSRSRTDISRRPRLNTIPSSFPGIDGLLKKRGYNGVNYNQFELLHYIACPCVILLKYTYE